MKVADLGVDPRIAAVLKKQGIERGRGKTADDHRASMAREVR